MIWDNGIGEALHELRNHKLRTFLTLLGMIFGVGSVISMLMVGKGAEKEALRLIDSMGLRNLIVEAKTYPAAELKEIREQSPGLRLADLYAARETLPLLSGDAATKSLQSYDLFGPAGQSKAEVVGVTPSYFNVSQLSMAAGRPLLELDQQFTSRVCVLGARAAGELFGAGNALGGLIKVDHQWLKVVGVLAAQSPEQAEFEGIALKGPDAQVLMPLTTRLRLFRDVPFRDEIDRFIVQVEPGVASVQAAKPLAQLMEVRHQNVDDFNMVVPEALLQQHRKTQSIFNIVMASIGAISLLVGGIGIMNIMLANVLERTREIGLRRAVGARRKDILQQFIAEALTISATGGLLGIVLGVALAYAIAGFSGWPVGWSLLPILLAVGSCGLIGLLFGIYPALKASRLDPIEALRHD